MSGYSGRWSPAVRRAVEQARRAREREALDEAAREARRQSAEDAREADEPEGDEW